MSNTSILLIIGMIAFVTQALRFLPFAIWNGNKKTPEYILWLGNVLPYAIMGMLVVYCLKGSSFATLSGWLPAAVALTLVTILQIWRRNTVLSVIVGTVCYMVLLHIL